jgi:hypothetical protein
MLLGRVLAPESKKMINSNVELFPRNVEFTANRDFTTTQVTSQL